MIAAGTGRLLEGAVSVVAGGSSGIGRAVVERFVEHGSVVEFAANDPDGVADLESKLRAAGGDRAWDRSRRLRPGASGRIYGRSGRAPRPAQCSG